MRLCCGGGRTGGKGVNPPIGGPPPPNGPPVPCELDGGAVGCVTPSTGMAEGGSLGGGA